MSLILRLAVQHEAIRDNPVRHLDPIEGGSRKPRALSTEERRRFLAWMQGTSDDEEETRAQVATRRRDLPDIATFMLEPELVSLDDRDTVKVNVAPANTWLAARTEEFRPCRREKVANLGVLPLPRRGCGAGWIVESVRPPAVPVSARWLLSAQDGCQCGSRRRSGRLLAGRRPC